MKYKNTNKKWINVDSVVLKDVDNIKFFINKNKEGIIYYSKNTKKGKQIYITLKDLKTLDFSWFIKMLPTDKKISRIFYVNGDKYILSGYMERTIYKANRSIQSYKNKGNFVIKKAIIISNRECDIKIQESASNILTILVNLSLMNLFKSKDILDSELVYKQNTELKNVLEEIENKDTHIKVILNKIREKEKVINYERMKNKELSEEINIKDKKINELEIKLSKSEENNSLKSKENKIIIYKYENRINAIREEKDELLERVNSKLYRLFKILEEKDELLEKFHLNTERK